MKVRRGRPTDAGALAALHRQLFPEGPWDESVWRGAFLSSFDHVICLGEPVRAFGLLRIIGEEAEVLTIGTSTPGQGDGGRLLSVMSVLAISHGAQCLFLEVSTANKAAQRLYAGAGFSPEGRRKAYYRDGSDAVIMRLDLPQGVN